MLTGMFQILTAMLHGGGIFCAIGWDVGGTGSIGGWQDTKLVMKAFGKIGEIVEADLVGDFGDITVWRRNRVSG